MKLRWNSRGKLHESQGELSRLSPLTQMVIVIAKRGGWTAWAVAKNIWRGPSGSCPLSSDGSRDGQVGRLDCMSSGQKTFKAKLNLEEDYPGSSLLRSDGSHDSQLEAGPLGQWPKMLKWKSENNFRQPKDLLKRARETAQQKESTYSLSGDVEEVRYWRWCWWWVENHCAVTEPCDSNTEHWRTFCLNSVFIVLP
jgi:hypothetical protein